MSLDTSFGDDTLVKLKYIHTQLARITPITKVICIKSFFNEGMYNPTWISRKLKLTREFTEDVLRSLHSDINPVDKVIDNYKKVDDSDELLIKSYFQNNQNSFID